MLMVASSSINLLTLYLPVFGELAENGHVPFVGEADREILHRTLFDNSNRCHDLLGVE